MLSGITSKNNLRAACLAALALMAGTERSSAQRCATVPLLVSNVDVWTSAGRLQRRDVLARDGKIVSIEPAGPPVQGIRTIDGTGHTLLPGLVDAHLHFVFPGGLPTSNGPRTDGNELAARELIRSGVTAGRLHLATLDEATRLKSLAQDECAAVPRLQVGGPGLSGALTKDFNNFQGALTEADARAKVERFRAAGIDWIAIHDAHRFPPGVLGALTQAAKTAGLRLMASGATRDEALAALSTEPDTLDYIDRSSQTEYAHDVVDRLRVQRNVIAVPTIGVARRVAELTTNPTLIEDGANFGALTTIDRAFLIDAARRDLLGKEAEAVRTFAPTLASKLRQLQKAGVSLALGSDAGSMLHWPSNAIWWEMEAWRAAGFSHRDVLRAATEGGSRVLKWDDVGRLTPGGRADFVLYRGDVEEGAFDRNRVIVVAKAGVLFQAPDTALEIR